MTKPNKTLFAVAFFNLAFGLGAAGLSSLPTPTYLIGVAQGLAMSTLGLLLLVWWLAGKHREERLQLEERLQQAVDCLKDRAYEPAPEPEPAPTRYHHSSDTSATYLGQFVEVCTYYDAEDRVVGWLIEVDGKELAYYPQDCMGLVNADDFEDGSVELRDVWYWGSDDMGHDYGPRDLYISKAVAETEQAVALTKLRPYLERRAKYIEEFSKGKCEVLAELNALTRSPA